MAEVIGVRFKEVGKIYYFDPDGKAYQKGDRVIVETSRGIECGDIVMENAEVAEENIVRPLKMIIRLATQEDMQTVAQNREKEKEAFGICVKKAAELKLDMKLVDVEFTFDASKLLFYFTSDGRVDFRELVKSLASVFRTRIEMRQICVRDESKMLGGLGVCGRAFCCSEFLGEFHPVSIKMAKEQGLSLNPVKISGTCGRLMCCLKYEQESYEYLQRITPKIGDTVNTKDGEGTVVENSLITGTLKVALRNRQETAPSIYNVKDVKPVRNAGSKSEKEDRDLSDTVRQ